MSVSFNLAIQDSDTLGWRISCFDKDENGHTHDDLYGTWEEVRDAYLQKVETGEVIRGECYTDPIRFVDETCDFTLSNTNARDVLHCLGFAAPVEDDPRGDAELEVPLCGTCDGENLLARVAVARALAPDISRQGYTEIGANGAMLIDHGRDSQYLARALEKFERLGRLAVRSGRDVSWG